MREGALIGPVIVAIGLVVAAIAFAVTGTLLDTADGRVELRLDRGDADIARMQARLDRLEEELRAAREESRSLAEDLALLPSRIAAAPAATADATASPPQAAPVLGELGEHQETAVLDEIMTIARTRFNKGITQPRNATMREILGEPRAGYGQDCQAVTDPGLKALIETRTVGPITVSMIRPALASLQRILTRLQESDPDIYGQLGTAGALCARFVRGSTRSISNHSWGTAIDLKLMGKLDGFGDGGTQFGLLILAELFNDEGWYWGAGYKREDSMHFEVGEETLRSWLSAGLL